MPVTFSFDMNDVADVNDRARIQVAFQRLGWEHIGGSSWRYPALASKNGNASEDWFNHVIPALMYFRCLVEHSGINVSKFTLDAHSEAGFRAGISKNIGAPIVIGEDIQMYTNSIKASQKNKLSEVRLRQFVSGAAKLLE